MQAAWLLKAVTMIDLTTLAGDDTEANVSRLCLKAARPVRKDLIEAMDMAGAGITTGAGCVYPNRVAEAVACLAKYKAEQIPVAAVATGKKKKGHASFQVLLVYFNPAGTAQPARTVIAGFPSGQFPLSTRLQEIQLAVADGAREIDIVINRSLALEHQWQQLYE